MNDKIPLFRLPSRNSYFSLPVFERRPPLSSAVSEKGLAALSVAPSLPFVPVVSPPRHRGGSWPGARDVLVCAISDAMIRLTLSRTPRVPGACQAHFLARCRRGGPVRCAQVAFFSLISVQWLMKMKGNKGARRASASFPFGGSMDVFLRWY
jgi:hypothetical protein